MADLGGVDVWRIVAPRIEARLAMCASESLPLSEPAQAVRAILLELVERLDRKVRRASTEAAAPTVAGSAPSPSQSNIAERERHLDHS